MRQPESVVVMSDTMACRVFVGDLGNEVNDDVLQKSFQKYTSLVKAKVVRDKRTNKTKGEHSMPPTVSMSKSLQICMIGEGLP